MSGRKLASCCFSLCGYVLLTFVFYELIPVVGVSLRFAFRFVGGSLLVYGPPDPPLPPPVRCCFGLSLKIRPRVSLGFSFVSFLFVTVRRPFPLCLAAYCAHAFLLPLMEWKHTHIKKSRTRTAQHARPTVLKTKTNICRVRPSVRPPVHPPKRANLHPNFWAG